MSLVIHINMFSSDKCGVLSGGLLDKTWIEDSTSYPNNTVNMFYYIITTCSVVTSVVYLVMNYRIRHGLKTLHNTLIIQSTCSTTSLQHVQWSRDDTTVYTESLSLLSY